MAFRLLLLCTFSSAAAEHTAFTNSAQFERWSHFKDYGVPAVMGKDAVNSAAVADGSCRMVKEVDGYFFWHYPGRVQRVLEALAAAPPTSNPSYFTLTTTKSLRDACADKEDVKHAPAYNYSSVSSSVQNWYHALCAPEHDASWGGKFDPAYQPQQMALTAGFICIAACDAAGHALSASSMSSLATTSEAAQAARDAVCAAFPWGKGTDFSAAASASSLSKMATPLLGKPCRCDSSEYVV